MISTRKERKFDGSMYYQYGLGDDIDVSVDLSAESIGSISTSFKVSAEKDESDGAFNAGIDGLESLLLAMACQGVDITDDKIVNAVYDAVEGIANNT